MSNEALIALNRADKNIAHAAAAESQGPSNIFSEYIHATYKSAIGRPAQSLKQLAGFSAEVSAEPELHGAMKAAESLGAATGSLLDFAILSKACGGALNRLGICNVIGETALHSTLTAGAVGFIDGAILTPVDNGASSMRRIGNGIVEAGAFGTMGSVAAKGRESFGESFVGRLKTNAIAGATGGAVHAELDAAVHGQKASAGEVLGTAASWAVGNVALGSALSKLHSLTEPREIVTTGEIPTQGKFSRPIKYSIKGNDVDFEYPRDFQARWELPKQVRLLDHTGFIVDGTKRTSLRELPAHIDSVGRLSYEADSTTLTTPDGTFERSLQSGKIKTVNSQGDRVVLQEDDKIEITRLNRDRANFVEGRLTSITEGTGASGSAWTFHEDGSFQMRSMPSGKYRIYVSPNGEGESVTIAGTSRSIGGRVRSTNHLPYDKHSTPISYDHKTGEATGFQMPNITPIEESLLEKMRSARKLLKGLAV